ncbi:hypothetical protein J2P12_04860, partial [Candidatus Bathyarchaeota archaeon]|nr:hypothetical protein [Candidatus Bathyarchaeota archaeon]
MKRRARIGLMFDYLIPAMLLSLLLAIPAPVNIVSTGTAPFFTALVNSGVGVANGYAVITQGLISYVSEDVNSVLVGSPSFAPVSGGPSVSTTPSLSISPTTSAGAYYYEATYSSEIQSVTFNVTNAGGSSTGLLAIKLSDSSVFTKSSDFCTGRALAPKSSCSVIISYAPISGRAETDSVFLAANGKRASTSIILIGTSPGLMLDQATCSSASAPTDFSGIWNSTASTCTVTTGALSSGYTLVVPSGTKMIVGNRANGSAFSNYGTVNVESGGSVDNYGAFTDEMSGIVNNRGAFTNEFSGTITFENGVSGNIGIINGYLGKFYNYGS